MEPKEADIIEIGDEKWLPEAEEVKVRRDWWTGTKLQYGRKSRFWCSVCIVE